MWRTLSVVQKRLVASAVFTVLVLFLVILSYYARILHTDVTAISIMSRSTVVIQEKLQVQQQQQQQKQQQQKEDGKRNKLMESTLQSLFHLLDKTRNDSISSIPDNANISCNQHEKFTVLDLKNKEHLQNIKENHNFITIHKHLSANEVKCLLLNKYYKFASNDCTLLQSNQLDRYNEARNESNHTQCQHRMLDLVKSIQPQVEMSQESELASTDSRQQQEDIILASVHVLNNGLILPDGNVIMKGQHVLTGGCDTYATVSKCPTQKILRGTYDHEEVFIVSQALDRCPAKQVLRIAPYVEFLRRNPQIKMHTSIPNSLLTLVGLNESQAISGALIAKRLYVPVNTACDNPSYYDVQAMSHILRKFKKQVPTKRDLVLLVKPTSHKKFSTKYASIMQMLKAHARIVNLTVEVYQEDLSLTLERIMQLFDRSLAVVAPHGMQGSNLMFSRPGTLVLEGLCHIPGVPPQTCNKNLAHELGLRYYGIISEQNCISMSVRKLEKPFIEFISLYILDSLP